MLEQILIFLSLCALLLVALNIALLLHIHKNNKKIDDLLEKGKIKDFKSIFLSQKEKNEDLEEKIKASAERIRALENLSQSTFQKIGVVRFNPFNNLGGNQSFVIALLDKKNSGFLISSLFVQDGNRVYAKAINNGESDFPLSAEEQEAVSRAIGTEKTKRKAPK